MRRSIRRIIFAILGAVFIVTAGIYSAGFWRLAGNARQSAGGIKDNFRSALAALKRLEPGEAKRSFEEALQSILSLRDETNGFAPLRLLIKSVPATLTSLAELSSRSIQLAAEIEILKNDGFQWFAGGKGQLLTDHLKKLRAAVSGLPPLISQLKQQAAVINYPIDDDWTAASEVIYQNRQLLDAVISWLSADEPQHILILFQNQTEIRPGGGFLGSYADAVVSHGALINLAVRDIYDADGQLPKKIVPPLALQTVTPRWGARDANWFLDFPTSARKTIQMLEASLVHREQQTHFSAAVAVNTRLIEDLLRVTGPIALPGYGLTLDADTFLPTIQREIEAGADNAAGHPKKIMQALTPLLFERLGAITGKQKNIFLRQIAERFANKDIMIYAEDPVVESFLKTWLAAGEIFPLAKDFNGDYLAVVNANVAGGKSDAFVRQTINLESDLGLTGILTNTLRLRREFRQPDSTDWWYQRPNQDFVQILTPPRSALQSLEGGADKKISAPLDYRRAGYEIDPDVEAAETETAFGRQRFSAWLTVAPGETKTLTAAYHSGHALDLEKPLTVVFEKQSGVDSALRYSIAAPVGYLWQESGKPVFRYEADNAPARLILKLHLTKV